MRIQSPASLRELLAVAVVAAALFVSGVTSADTIYLKNGRVIETASAKQVGDKVEFEQFGQTATIPASVVLRIEHDDRAEEPPIPAPVPTPAPAEGDPGTESGETGDGDDDGEEVAPETTREYWRDRIHAIEREKAELVTMMTQLRREERAFLFSKRSTAELRERIEAVQAREKELDQESVDLRREARRLGIPPGWLRVGPAPIES